RSTDGGRTWVNLGWDQHPDFHAFAWDPSNAGHVVFGNDGGVYDSPDLGGRPKRTDPLNAEDWQNLNGGGLAIAQLSSIATNPTDPGHWWGGTQDNGTEEGFPGDPGWYDVTSGDGGQVLVDPTDSNYVYGEYYDVSPYRITDGGSSFFSNKSITHGLNTNERSEFYLPFVLNHDNVNQLFTGTFRMYRTDNAKAPSAGDVTWKPISGDLSSGCTGTAPNGGRGCFISAIGIGGGDAAYAGTEEGWLWTSKDAQTADAPSWTRSKDPDLPNRPVGTIAVDRSNYRVAYAGYNGFDAATPKTPGHVFKTTDGGHSWTNVTGNLPNSPVNSLVIDPSYPNTLYAGTDVGALVSYDGGAHWGRMGSALPVISVWQLDMNPANRTIAAGTHGRSAFALADSNKVPALELSAAAADRPIGPGSDVQYTLTVKNLGNAAATGVQVTDPIPPNTSFVSAGQGGTRHGGTVMWSGLTVPAGESRDVTLTVHVASNPDPGTTSITNDGYRTTSAEGQSADGSPVVTPFSPPHAVSAAPATQTAGAHPGHSFGYKVTLRNRGSDADSYALSVASNWSAEVRNADCSAPLATTPTVAPGDTADVCVQVTVPDGAAEKDSDTATLTAKSTADPTVSATAAAKTIAVTTDTLLVDDDTNAPVDSQPYYRDALSANGVQFSTWDLAQDSDLPQNYMTAFKNIVWFTGNSYPGPLLNYEGRLRSFLDGGGNFLVSGQDILDQGAGTTDFVRNYLHIDWDGSETQNDKATNAVHGVAGTLSDGVGAVPLDHNVLDAAYEDQITPNAGAGVFTDDSGATDGLQFAGGYKVVFLAFPLEAYGTAAQKADLVGRVMSFFGS
ncbi:MAG TPA: hypothetical protein VE287_04080, partial [Actinopolymorphaceae bacterium]|nr:hypothetical protein [Actinopolymorphaceae bacterium]